MVLTLGRFLNFDGKLYVKNPMKIKIKCRIEVIISISLAILFSCYYMSSRLLDFGRARRRTRSSWTWSRCRSRRPPRPPRLQGKPTRGGSQVVFYSAFFGVYSFVFIFKQKTYSVYFNKNNLCSPF